MTPLFPFKVMYVKLKKEQGGEAAALSTCAALAAH